MKVAQSCLTLCDPMDYTVHGILQARILEWGVVFPFSRGSSQPRFPALQADSLPAEPQGKSYKGGDNLKKKRSIDKLSSTINSFQIVFKRCLKNYRLLIESITEVNKSSTTLGNSHSEHFIGMKQMQNSQVTGSKYDHQSL